MPKSFDQPEASYFRDTENINRMSNWSGIPVKEVKEIEEKTQDSEIEQLKHYSKTIKNRTVQHINQVWESETLGGTDVIKQYWEHLNNINTINSSNIKFGAHETTICQVYDAKGLRLFWDKLCAFAKQSSLTIDTQENAIAAYHQMSESDPEHRYQSLYQRLEESNLSELYDTEELKILAIAVEAEKDLKQHLNLLQTTALTQMEKYYTVNGIEPPQYYKEYVDHIIDSRKFFIVQNVIPYHTFGETLYFSTFQRSEEGLNHLQAFVKEKVPKAKRWLQIDSPTETFSVSGFEGQDADSIINTATALVPKTMLATLEKISKAAQNKYSFLERIQYRDRYGDIADSGVAGAFSPSTGELSFFTNQISKFLDSSEIWMFIHEITHGDELNLIKHPELLAEYLAILPTDDQTLTNYVKTIRSNNAEMQYITKQNERFSDLHALLFMDPNRLKEKSELLYLWAKKYSQARFGEKYDIQQEAIKRWNYVCLYNEGISAQLCYKVISNPEILTQDEIALLKQKLANIENQIRNLAKIDDENTSDYRERASQEYHRWIKLAETIAKTTYAQTGEPATIDLSLMKIDQEGKIVPIDDWITQNPGQYNVFMVTGKHVKTDFIHTDVTAVEYQTESLLSPACTFVTIGVYNKRIDPQDLSRYLSISPTSVEYRIRVTIPPNTTDNPSYMLYSYQEQHDLVI